MLSEKATRDIEVLRTTYPQGQSALLPALSIAQGECGYLGDHVLEEVARLLDIPTSEVESVASFYSLFNRRRVGANVIRLCTNLSCLLLGADTVASYVSRKLGIGHGETTADGKITLELVECLGACDQAPVMMVNDRLYGHLTVERVDEILAELQGLS